MKDSSTSDLIFDRAGSVSVSASPKYVHIIFSNKRKCHGGGLRSYFNVKNRDMYAGKYIM